MELPRIVKELPKAPKGVREWIIKDVAQNAYIIYDKKQNRAVCTRCGAVYDTDKLEDLKHNGKGECLSCCHTVTYKAAGIGRKSLEELTRVLVFVRKGKSIYASLTDVNISFEDEAPEVRIWLSAVYKFSQKEQLYAKHHAAWCFADETWSMAKKVRIAAVPRGSFYFPPKRDGLHVYTDNWDNLFEESDLKHADVRQFFDDYELSGEELIRYLDLHLKYKSIELLRKSGFERFVLNKIGEGYGTGCIYWRGTELRKIMRMDMGEIRRIREQDFDVIELSIYKEYQKKGYRLSSAEIQIVQADKNTWRTNKIEEMPLYMKVVKYIAEQNNKYKNQSTMGDFYDYLEDCEKFALDTRKKSVLFPENFHKAHQELSKKIAYEKNKEEYEAVVKAVAQFEEKHGEYHRDGLFIRVARTVEEIKQEGSRQGHCVGGYTAKVARGDSLILFVRKETEPEKNYYTLELSSSGTVIQCRGVRNSGMTQEVQKFVEEWEKSIKQKPKKVKKNAKVA